MRILYGENTVQSRNQLVRYLSAAQTAGQQVTHLDAKTLDRVVLERELGSSSLFAEPQLIVIEDLHSLPKSKKKDELIKMIGEAAQQTELGQEIILWEKRDLTPTMLKKFATAQTEQFRLSSNLFIWLDALSGQKNEVQIKKMLNLFQKANQSDGDFMCFSLFVRQIRLLIQAKENNFAGLAPFMIAKLQRQSQSFSIEQLLQIHHQLLQIDLGQKTSTARFSLSQELELLLIGL